MEVSGALASDVVGAQHRPDRRFVGSGESTAGLAAT
jgi:hypothetical protein